MPLIYKKTYHSPGKSGDKGCKGCINKGCLYYPISEKKDVRIKGGKNHGSKDWY